MALLDSYNFDDSTPVAPAGRQNVKWQADSSTIRNISAYMVPMVGDSGAGGVSGAVPTPAAGDAAANKFLKANGSWAAAVLPTRTIATTAPLTGGGDLSADRTLAISNFTGDSGAGGAKGAVPAPAAGDAAAGKFLKSDGNWAVPGGGTSWSSITDPGGNLSLTMAADTSLFTFNAATGANDLFKLTDTTNNTGTGALLALIKASGSNLIGLRLKQNDNGPTQALLQLENSSAAVQMELHVNDVAGSGTNRIEATGGPFLLTRGGTATSNQMLVFSDINTSKWLATITSKFDGLTGSEVGLTVNNLTTMGGTSVAAVLSVQNNGTRLFDVAPAAVTVKSASLLVLEASHTPSSASDTGVAGQIAWDSNFIYICVATNTWKRVAISTW